MSRVINKPIEDVLETLVEEASGTVLVVDPSPTVLKRLIDVAVESSNPPEIHGLASNETLKAVSDDFLVASNSADLVEAGVLSLRAGDASPGNQLFITTDGLTALVSAGDAIAALSCDDDAFVDTAFEYYTDVWNDAEPYSLRTPPLSQVKETLREEIGSDAEADFSAVLRSLGTARGDGGDLDEVTISLLVAAKNEELLYDISKWGEDVGIASKATFSRTKTTLEDLGLIDTEKVPINVGRPRLRLKFGHEKLQGASADELASVAEGLLA